jgi:hypothetical protein
MSAFAAALAALHADPNMAEAGYYRRPPWPWAPTRIVRTAPNDVMASLGSPGARAGSLSVDVLAAALTTTPQRGDELKLGTIVYTVEDSERDTLGLSWRLTLSALMP